jgi:hypothetical protein
MPYQPDDFEGFVSRMNTAGAPSRMCAAIMDVADAAYACKLWFEGNGFQPTAGDVVAMTRLMLERQVRPESALGPWSVDALPRGRSANAEQGLAPMNGHSNLQ